MATLQDYRNERIRKLEEIRAMGVDPYPASTKRDTKIDAITTNFNEMNEKTVTVAGRITGIRKFGKITFIVIRDFSGEIQLFLKFENIDGGDKSDKNHDLFIKNLNLLDTGDFIEATGEVGKTKTGEISVMVRRLKILTKALRPMPNKQEGFTNKEERFRRRYVDMNVNLDVRNRFVRRAKFWQATREFLLKNDFIEINIPVLEHTTGGADANPFVTHMDALGQDFYLRISHELPLKRLIGAGFEKVFDIGPRFRNEGISDEHLPEHIAMESYAAYQDYNDGIKFYEEMIKFVCEKTWGTLQFSYNDMSVDLSGEWPRIKYADIMKEKFGVDVFNPDKKQLQRILTENHVKLDSEAGVERMLDNVWKLIRKDSVGPFWMIDEPASISPLAKSDPKDPCVTQRFHPIIFGTEMGNGFSELNDPIDQLERFLEQQSLRDAGDNEAMMLDIDFVEMLEYGMPPTCGWGNSERNFWIFEGVSAREGVPFPHMKKEISETTRAIYSDVRFE